MKRPTPKEMAGMKEALYIGLGQGDIGVRGSDASNAPNPGHEPEGICPKSYWHLTPDTFRIRERFGESDPGHTGENRFAVRIEGHLPASRAMADACTKGIELERLRGRGRSEPFPMNM